MINILKEKDYQEVYEKLIEDLFYSKTNAKHLILNSPFKITLLNEDKMIGFLFANKQKIQINSYCLEANELVTLGVHTDYRNRGHSAELFTAFDNYTKKQSLITFTKTYATKLFSKNGYMKLYDTYRYTITKQNFMYVDIDDVVNEYTADDLCSAYQKFVGVFNNYVIKDKKDYENVITKVRSENKKIVVYKNAQRCLGYAIYNTHKNGVCVVEEIIYLNTSVLKSLLAFISENYFDVDVCVSEYEPLHQLFEETIYRKDKTIMIKINHLTLFNKLFQTKAKLQQELLETLKNKCYFGNYFI